MKELWQSEVLDAAPKAYAADFSIYSAAQQQLENVRGILDGLEKGKYDYCLNAKSQKYHSQKRWLLLLNSGRAKKSRLLSVMLLPLRN